MNILNNYKKFLEKVQADFFQKNPDFYLKNKVKDAEKIELELLLKKIQIKDIKIKIDGDYILFPQFGDIFMMKHEDYIIVRKNPYLWKLILSYIFKSEKNNYNFLSSDGDIGEFINDIFKNISNYYGLYYKGDYEFILFLTKSKNEYSEKIKFCKERNIKIIYYNNNVKGGRDFFDIDKIKKMDYINKFKKVKEDDIFLKKIGDDNHISYVLYFKDENLNELYFKLARYRLSFDSASKSQTEEDLFGDKIGHRFHLRTGLPDSLKGIGLGYKIYRILVKTVGYICSNSQTTQDARNIYNKLINDSDFYSIVDNVEKDLMYKNVHIRSKVMIIDKNYKYINKLMELVKKREKFENGKYIYDKELQNL